MPSDSDLCRRDRILDAAEHVFGEAGFAGASLRQIVKEARVNLATVYYYFGSKNGLMEEVLKRRLGPLREEHLQILRRAQQSRGGAALSVGEVLEAMLLPPLRLAACDSQRRQAVMRLIGRIVSEPSQQIQAILHAQRAEVRAAFFEALQASLPDVPADKLLWRLEFVWGALAFILCNPKKLEQDTQGQCNLAETPKVLAEMVQFFSPGFAAGHRNGAKSRRKRTRRTGARPGLLPISLGREQNHLPRKSTKGP